MKSQASDPTAFWSLPLPALLAELGTSDRGLDGDEARRRLEQDGGNVLAQGKSTTDLALFLAQFKSPVTLILLFAAGLSFFLHDSADALIILAIVLIGGLLGFWQERGAVSAVGRLLEIVRVKVSVLRDGIQAEIPLEGVVRGDLVALSAGSIIPADSMILESNSLFVDEAALTGETFPVEKIGAVLPADTPLAKRTNMLWMGTHVVSGSAKAVVATTGKRTEFGQIYRQLAARQPETEFEQGVRRFGYLLMEVTLLLVMMIFFVNVFLARPVLDSFLFSLALAVGLTPQLLPAIISVNLAHGARRMSEEKVIVKRLASIENFGSMNVLCCDKTGTLTAGSVRLHSALDADGREDAGVLFHAWLNANFETGFANPIDEAIRGQGRFEASDWRKLDEEPYDFVRKRLSVLLAKDGGRLIITKGALPNVLAVCTNVVRDGKEAPLDGAKAAIQKQFEEFSAQGFRVLGVASKRTEEALINRSHECEMSFLGFLLLFDPLKPGIAATVRDLSGLGISLKLITGDNRHIAASVGRQVGLNDARVLTGAELRATGSAALIKQVQQTHVFAEVEPNQKERILLALRKAGNVTGFMGDGINDATALRAADVGISVDSAVDVAKEAADIVLLEHDLGVLVRGVAEGRRTFANTLKYVFMATSANFGNMFSMAGASLFLPFLPLLPKQILLMNVLTDFPEMTIATDGVDPEMTARPRRWDIRFIRAFMIVFGLVSSIFDYLTFGALMLLLHATPGQFRTGWFVESVASAALIVLVVRTRRPFHRSKPGRALLLATLGTIVATLLLPLTPLAAPLGFERLPLGFLLPLAGIVALYIFTAELAKRIFYRRWRS